MLTAPNVWRSARPIGCLQRVHDIVNDLKDALFATFKLLELLESLLMVSSRVRLSEIPLILEVFTVLAHERTTSPRILLSILVVKWPR